MSTSNYEKSAARHLMAENPGMNYTTALRAARAMHDVLRQSREAQNGAEPAPEILLSSGSDTLYSSPQLAVVGSTGRGKLVLIENILYSSSHLAVVGSTGCGKSVLIENIVARHLEHGDKVYVADPHAGVLIPNAGYRPHFEPYLAEPAATSARGIVDLVEQVLSDRTDSTPRLLVVDGISVLTTAESGSEALRAIERALRTARSHRIRVVLSSQSAIGPSSVFGSSGVEGLYDKVIAANGASRDTVEWFEPDFGREWVEQVGETPKGTVLYIPATDTSVSDPRPPRMEVFLPPLISSEEFETRMRIAGVKPRSERD